MVESKLIFWSYDFLLLCLFVFNDSSRFFSFCGFVWWSFGNIFEKRLFNRCLIWGKGWAISSLLNVSWSFAWSKCKTLFLLLILSWSLSWSLCWTINISLILNWSLSWILSWTISISLILNWSWSFLMTNSLVRSILMTRWLLLFSNHVRRKRFFLLILSLSTSLLRLFITPCFSHLFVHFTLHPLHLRIFFKSWELDIEWWEVHEIAT